MAGVQMALEPSLVNPVTSATVVVEPRPWAWQSHDSSAVLVAAMLAHVIHRLTL